MRVRLLGAILVLTLQGTSPANAADHGDGLMDLAVVAGLGLVEGPPYPATPAEIDTVLRHPPSAPLATGRLLMRLVAAADAVSAAPIALTGVAVDNAQSGEAGDTVVLDVFFVPGAPPDDVLPELTALDFELAAVPAVDGSRLEFKGTATVVGPPTQRETTIEGDLYDGPTSQVVEHGRLELDFASGPVQDVSFESLDVTNPGTGSEITVAAELRKGASGTIEPSEPLFRLTLTITPIVPVPAVSPGVIGVGAIVLLGIAVALRLRGRERGRA